MIFGVAVELWRAWKLIIWQSGLDRCSRGMSVLFISSEGSKPLRRRNFVLSRIFHRIWTSLSKLAYFLPDHSSPAPLPIRVVRLQADATGSCAGKGSKECPQNAYHLEPRCLDWRRWKEVCCKYQLIEINNAINAMWCHVHLQKAVYIETFRGSANDQQGNQAERCWKWDICCMRLFVASMAKVV